MQIGLDEKMTMKGLLQANSSSHKNEHEKEIEFAYFECDSAQAFFLLRRE